MVYCVSLLAAVAIPDIGRSPRNPNAEDIAVMRGISGGGQIRCSIVAIEGLQNQMVDPFVF